MSPSTHCFYEIIFTRARIWKGPSLDTEGFINSVSKYGTTNLNYYNLTYYITIFDMYIVADSLS